MKTTIKQDLKELRNIITVARDAKARGWSIKGMGNNYQKTSPGELYEYLLSQIPVIIEKIEKQIRKLGGKLPLVYPRRNKMENKNNFMITEEWTGYFYYHISYRNTYTIPICGKDITTMYTAIPLDAWGVVTHIKERYCPKCKELYDKAMNNET